MYGHSSDPDSGCFTLVLLLVVGGIIAARSWGANDAQGHAARLARCRERGGMGFVVSVAAQPDTVACWKGVVIPTEEPR